MDIGRNDPCHCGSGKKYKKCCMKKETSLEAIRHEDLEKLQIELMEFASANFSRHMDEAVKEKMGKLDRDKHQNVYGALLVWAVFSASFVPGRVIEAFVHKKQKEEIRPSTLSQLKQWTEAAPSFSVIESIIDDEWFNVRDIFSNEEKKVKVVQGASSFEEGGLLLGYLLPYGEYHSYYLMQLEFEKNQTAHNKKLTLDLFKESEFIDPKAFMEDNYPEMIISMLTEPEEMKAESEKELIWDNMNYELPVRLLEEKLTAGDYFEDIELLEETRGLAVQLMHSYFHRLNPSIKKHEIYAAAMHYFIEKHIHKMGLTQKALADMYGVSTSSLSKLYRELKGEMEQDLQDLQQEKEKQPSSHHASARDQAQKLIFQAMKSDPAMRLKLAEEAIKIYPYHPDAYSILGEAEQDLKKQLQFFKKGMEAGETDLGKDYFKQNKGMFWGLTETRPYMRAKFNYAVLEAAAGNLEIAIKQCEELLDLDENDNQGVRYTLFAMYMDLGMYKQAEKLMEKYDESHMASGAYNRVLLEFALNGVTSNLKQLVNKAKEINPFVFDYLTVKKSLPAPPDSFGIGDQNEAVQYVYENEYIWSKHPNLIEWVKNNS
ncbi:cyclin family protein [Metabacillus dongyingensis]|uniref:cyclin family protein n=1 Tax=Metabacillus dongyingensis TaxID=2874282 RepID=UPI001CBDF313|nr:cyclin family protein [Metabacillus dongyingensis]UAL52041.1 SEC-C domain-containing protein [Metabacillus dongyingensis]